MLVSGSGKKIECSCESLYTNNVYTYCYIIR
jgi:hypothetical protein